MLRTTGSDGVMRRVSAATALGVALVSTSLVPAPFASAAAIIDVTTTTDELNGDGDCSLREAIRAANLDDPVSGCTEGDGTDTIKVPAGTYTLTESDPSAEDLAVTGDLDVTSIVKIQGRGVAKTVIDGNAIDRVFDIRSGGFATIRRLTIRNGDTIGQQNGGGLLVRNGGEAFLRDLSIKKNKAGANGGGLAVETTGDLVGHNLTISGNEAIDFSGGGVMNNNNDIELSGVTIRGNTTPLDGGGLYSYGGLITNSTISGNEADDDGGGVYVSSGFITIKNSTITQNTADNDGLAAGDGGGITRADVAPKLGNTILAENTDTGGEAPDCASTLTSLGYNLIGDTTGCTVSGDTTGNITGEDPDLGPLADNGGSTPTHSLGPDSPAINAGNTVGPDEDQCRPKDQRGVPRRNCDIGAYERIECRGVLVNRVGTNGPDTLAGTGGRDGFIGRGSADKLKGRGGRDALCGQAGKDRLVAGPGDDFLHGGGGSDTGKGGPGDDRCVKVETKIGPCLKP